MGITVVRHNGRVGKDGLLLAKHNSRNFDLSHASHIDSTKTPNNIFWDCYYGFRTYDEIKNKESFTDIEQKYYKDHYQKYIDCQDARNAKTRHSERNKTTEDLRKNKKTCPEESIVQIGNMNDDISSELLIEIFSEFIFKFQEKYGNNVHFLDWALHVDEVSPHIHERHVFDGFNKHGELQPSETIAFRELDINRPDMNEPEGRYNNPKMNFDKSCLELLCNITKSKGIDVVEEVVGNGRKHYEKQDYIIFNQKQRIEYQQNIIDNLDVEIEQKRNILKNLSISDELTKLWNLCEKGILTEFEFNTQKQKLLNLQFDLTS